MSIQPQNQGDEQLPLQQDLLPKTTSTDDAELPRSKGFSVVNQEIPVALEHALIRTLAMLQQTNLATAEDCTQVSAMVKSEWLAGKGADPVDCLVRLTTGDNEMLEATVEAISIKLAETLPFQPTRIPFAGKLIAPSSLYEKNPDIELMCRLMLVPIAYAEDLDVLALASINPYFVDALSPAISDYTMEKNNTQPIISSVRLDYTGWQHMCGKHFRKDSES
ncbi:MAG: hypothetical protein ACPIA7_02100 [Akkermansiaceae bacterium]